MPKTPGIPGQRGLSMIEMVIAIVILAVALVSISVSISVGLGRNADVMLETRAVALAQSYLDEIFGRRFDENSNPRGIPPCSTNCTDELDFGPDLPETERIDFDDVDDYHGLDEGLGQTDPLRDAEGLERTGYENFRVRVAVRYLELVPDGVTPGVEETLGVNVDDLNNNTDAKLITVTVNHASNPQGWAFSVYKANF
ncbi:MAG: type II secretion system protein [Pseudomonadales bacterium]|nr:type II secretion system protein [Pseudomonadales bacterium]